VGWIISGWQRTKAFAVARLTIRTCGVDRLGIDRCLSRLDHRRTDLAADGGGLVIGSPRLKQCPADLSDGCGLGDERRSLTVASGQGAELVDLADIGEGRLALLGADAVEVDDLGSGRFDSRRRFVGRCLLGCLVYRCRVIGDGRSLTRPCFLRIRHIGLLVLGDGGCRELRRQVLKSGKVEVRRHSDRLLDAVGKAEVDRFFGGEPGLVLHHRLDLGIVAAGFVTIRADHAGLHLVEGIGHPAHVCGRSHDQTRGIVQHQHGVGRHDHLVAGHGDHRGDRRRDAVDQHRDPAIVALERVVDGDAVEHRAARAVDAQGEIGGGRQRLQLVEKSLGRNPEGADLLI
jgi:hypothetical protein